MLVIALLFVMMILVLYRGQQFDKEFICGFSRTYSYIVLILFWLIVVLATTVAQGKLQGKERRDDCFDGSQVKSGTQLRFDKNLSIVRPRQADDLTTSSRIY